MTVCGTRNPFFLRNRPTVENPALQFISTLRSKGTLSRRVLDVEEALRQSLCGRNGKSSRGWGIGPQLARAWPRVFYFNDSPGGNHEQEFIISVVVIFVLSMGLGFLVHGVLRIAYTQLPVCFAHHRMPRLISLHAAGPRLDCLWVCLDLPARQEDKPF
jgi:hypothetical protein